MLCPNGGKVPPAVTLFPSPPAATERHANQGSMVDRVERRRLCAVGWDNWLCEVCTMIGDNEY
ncbi:unnamed protein product [Protopolystoma xenopodis]|uniref:Uncharacterized protein n=1 Tax=Protopolystoma xenopodis TaxID=117903 RepID=A0A3S5AJW3_9PLAT|nr:unnamed protein product [Protopolystoma xenopodis]